jgi:uncharacterized protein (TIGR03000 family)
MKYQRFVLAVLAAVAVSISVGVMEGSAHGPYYGAAPMYYYPLYSDGPFGNPYMSELPGYGILPLPLNSEFLIDGRRNPYYMRSADDSTGVFPPQPARKRPSLYPAVPYEPTPKVPESDRRRVRFEIGVPYADATVTFDGAKTKQTGLERVFVTPPMDEGKEYTVTIAVQWTKQDGTQSVPRQKTFSATAGQTIRYTFVE